MFAIVSISNESDNFNFATYMYMWSKKPLFLYYNIYDMLQSNSSSSIPEVGPLSCFAWILYSVWVAIVINSKYEYMYLFHTASHSLHIFTFRRLHALYIYF